MSEYQYYEFQTIDRFLTATEREEIKQVSSRVNPTATKATFTYSYGDFPRDEKQFLAQYFDAMFYIANWGTLQLIFRFPKSLIETEKIQPYCLEDCLELLEIGNYIILSIYFNDEEGFGWIEEQDYLDSLINLRNDILQEDYRVLYLTWLKAIDWPELSLDRNTLEPPVPPQLNNLSPSLQAFAKIFAVDEFLIKAAAQNSTTRTKISDRRLKAAIAKLSRDECNDFLWKLFSNEPALSFALKKRLETFLDIPKNNHGDRRTASTIIEIARNLSINSSARNP